MSASEGASGVFGAGAELTASPVRAPSSSVRQASAAWYVRALIAVPGSEARTIINNAVLGRKTRPTTIRSYFLG